MITEILIYLLMNKILQATSRGQVTLPKNWRSQFATNYFTAECDNEKIVLKPIKNDESFKSTVEYSWEEYNNGEIIDGSDLMNKYGI